MHIRTTDRPLDAVPATRSQLGARTAATLLPLLLLGVAHLLPWLISPEQGSALRGGLAAAAALATGAGLFASVLLTVRTARLAGMLDAGAFGTLCGTFLLAAAHSISGSGIGIGLAFAAGVMAVRPLTGQMKVGPRPSLTVAWIALFIATEVAIALVLLGGPIVASGGSLGILCVATAALFAVSAARALRSDHDEPHFVVLLVAVSGALTLGLAGPTPTEAVVAWTTVSIAAALLGSTGALAAMRQLPSATTALSLVEPVADAGSQRVSEPAGEEAAQLAGEVRELMDELTEARRTVELQRDEIDRLRRRDLQ